MTGYLWRWARIREYLAAKLSMVCQQPGCKGRLEWSFGLAGGGYGSYLICWRCSAVHKSLRDAE